MKSRFLRDRALKLSNHTSCLKGNGTCTFDREKFRPGMTYVINEKNLQILERYKKQIENEKQAKNFR